MQLNDYGLQHEREQWEAAGYQLPQYDHAAMVEKPKENPFWLHFGSGNIFRAFQTNVVEGLLNDGILDRGIIAVGGSEAMEILFHPHANYTVLVTLKVDGTIDKTIIGSLAETLTTDAGYPEHFDRLKEIFTKDSLQMVSFTITEKGYSLVGNDGEFTDPVKADIEGMLRPMLENPESFGVNLYEVGMADQVIQYFKEMITHKGAVRDTLEKYVNMYV